MSVNTFEFKGLAELKRALQNLPAHLVDEARTDVLGAANGAAEGMRKDYRAEYPIKPTKRKLTGKLVAGVEVLTAADTSPFGVGAVVVNKTKYANMLEHGTYGHPPRPIFIRNVIRERKAMYTRLKAMLKREGLEVSGDA